MRNDHASQMTTLNNSLNKMQLEHISQIHDLDSNICAVAQRVYHQGLAQRQHIEDMQRMDDHYIGSLEHGTLAPH